MICGSHLWWSQYTWHESPLCDSYSLSPDNVKQEWDGYTWLHVDCEGRENGERDRTVFGAVGPPSSDWKRIERDKWCCFCSSLHLQNLLVPVSGLDFYFYSFAMFYLHFFLCFKEKWKSERRDRGWMMWLMERREKVSGRWRGTCWTTSNFWKRNEREMQRKIVRDEDGVCSLDVLRVFLVLLKRLSWDPSSLPSSPISSLFHLYSLLFFLFPSLRPVSFLFSTVSWLRMTN